MVVEVRRTSATPVRRRGTARRRTTRRGTQIVQYALLTVIGAVMLFPFFWMVASTMKTSVELGAIPPVWWPSEPSFGAFAEVFRVLPFARAILNSLIVTVCTTGGILITSILAGYVFSKHTFRGRDTIFVVVLATMMVPQFVMLIPLFRMMNALDLVNTYGGLILPNLANGFGIFLMRQFIAGIPDELLEAARIDGASEWKIVWSVVTPLLRPASLALILFAFVFHWNNFIWPLTIVQSPDMQTVVLALNGLRTYASSIAFADVVMAGTLIGIVPSVLLFLWSQRYFIEGIAMTGVKG